MLRRTAIAISMVWVLAGTAGSARAQDGATQKAHPARTRVVILGVDHSTQLVSRSNEAGMLTVFIEKLRPAAICIERTPELTERRDFYEFTYEVQGIVLPYVATHPTDLCPVDWMPTVGDQQLVFGSDLDQPPEIRPKSGFQTFMSFPDTNTLRSDIFAADDSAMTNPIRRHANTPASHADQDFPRRLYLYRTFMQSRHIRAVAKAHRGQTVLVVIGYFHKPDLENILSQDSTIELVNPSAIGHPTQQGADRAMTVSQHVAVLSFNLLGRQADTRNVDWAWVEQNLAAVERTVPSAEARLFRTRLDQLTGKLSASGAITRYQSLVNETSVQLQFDWTGVKDDARLDSYFDPFGNLTVRQRAMVELARAQRASGASNDATKTLDRLAGELGARKARQLYAYVSDYLPIGNSATTPHGIQ